MIATVVRRHARTCARGGAATGPSPAPKVHRPRAALPRLLASLLLLAAAAQAAPWSSSTPLTPAYHVNADGSVVLQVCFNWSCASRRVVTFSARDMARVGEQLALCGDASLHARLQRLRIGVWQMETLAEKALPILANDAAINATDSELAGRTDCIDNATNTRTYLQILADLGHLPGWSIAPPAVRDRFDVHNVHWTAVVTDRADGAAWAVDSWFRPNGHLPFVMPLQGWKQAMKGWKSPFDRYNPYPALSRDLCRAGGDVPAVVQADPR